MTVKRQRRILSASPDPYEVKRSVDTFSTGCTTLDLALGGGWAVGRIGNVVGDRSTGKTLLAIEACANFVRKFPKGRILYCEAEAAFDRVYAESLGLPKDRIVFPDVEAVEDLYAIVDERFPVDSKKTGEPWLLVVDSLDALSDRAENDRGISEATFGVGKAKALSTLFRRLVRRLAAARVTVIVISQVRDAIGVQFGERHRRSGGHALDFYATHAVWLAHTGRIKRTVAGVERAVGVNIRAQVKKNKIGVPFGAADFPILFNYGIEDLAACLGYLIAVKRTKEIGCSAEDAAKQVTKLHKMAEADYEARLVVVRAAVTKVWGELDDAFKPVRQKYSQQ